MGFDGFEVNEYKVCEGTREDWVQTYPVEGSKCGNGTVGYDIFFDEGQSIEGLDFGNQPPSDDGGGDDGGSSGGSSGGGSSSGSRPDPEPEGEVLGEQIAQVPLGAVNAGMGGTATAVPSLVGFISLILGGFGLSTTNRQK